MTEELKRLLESDDAFERQLIEAGRDDGPGQDLASRILANVSSEQPNTKLVRADFGGHNRLWLALGIAAAAGAILFIKNLDKTREPAQADLAAEPREPREIAPLPAAPSAVSTYRFEPCANPIVLKGNNPLIDDMEDRTARGQLESAGSGAWHTFNDGTGKQTPPPGPLHPSRLAQPRGLSSYAIHTSGDVLKQWGMVIGFYAEGARCFDASAYRGVSFWAKGKGRLRFGIKTSQTAPLEASGTCLEGCYDTHGKVLQLSKNFEQFNVPWADIQQKGFGTKVPFDPKSLIGIEFSLDSEDTPFEFWIDDLSFIQAPVK